MIGSFFSIAAMALGILLTIVLVLYAKLGNGFSPITGDTKSDEWGYDKDNKDGTSDPSSWYVKNEMCNGTRQSPVNIECHNIYSDGSLKNISFENYDQAVNGSEMINDGRTVRVTIPDSACLRISSPSWSAAYVLKQLHFHWGNGRSGGSEHKVNGKQWPLELHMVHANEAMSTAEAMRHPEGLVVLAVLFDKKTTKQQPTNKALDTLTSAATKVMKEDSRTIIDNFAIDSLLPEGASNHYLRYSGSLTTPPCSEVVEWIIFTRTLLVTDTQLNRFRSVKDTTGQKQTQIKANTRPLQPLNDRPIRLIGDLGKSIPKCKAYCKYYA